MLVKESGVDYHLVLGMKVKTCGNSPYLNNNGGARMDLNSLGFMSGL